MFKPLCLALSLSAIAASTLVAGSPARADDAMMMSKMDCSKAPEMLSEAQKMGYNSTSFGSGIGSIPRILLEREKGTNMMYKIEAQCGTDPQMKAMATKMAAQSDANIKAMESMMPADKKM